MRTIRVRKQRIADLTFGDFAEAVTRSKARGARAQVVHKSRSMTVAVLPADHPMTVAGTRLPPAEADPVAGAVGRIFCKAARLASLDHLAAVEQLVDRLLGEEG